MEQGCAIGVHVIYFVRKHKRGIAHLAEGATANEVLAGNYRTLCGQTVNPKKWTLVKELQKHYLCQGCLRKAAT